MRRPFDLSLYLVLDPGLCRLHSMVDTARLAVAGGVTMVQLRDKEAGTASLITTGLALKQALAGSGVPIIINDDVAAAIASEADGVHVGQEDLPVQAVRQQIGPDRLLGLSVEDAAAVRAVDPLLVDYLGVGPVFATPTKPDHKPPIGFDGLARLVRLSPLPTVAISGLKAEHGAAVLAAGADGMAVVSAICGQPDPTAAARHLAGQLRSVRLARTQARSGAVPDQSR